VSELTLINLALSKAFSFLVFLHLRLQIAILLKIRFETGEIYEFREVESGFVKHEGSFIVDGNG
jgi:hypothetical protein